MLHSPKDSRTRRPKLGEPPQVSAESSCSSSQDCERRWLTTDVGNAPYPAGSFRAVHGVYNIGIMKKYPLWLFGLLVTIFVCSDAQKISSTWPIVEEPSGTLRIAAAFGLEGGLAAIGLRIQNNSKEQIVIDWTRCNIITPAGESTEIIWSGPNTIPPNAYIISAIAPASGEKIRVKPDDRISIYLIWRDSRREYQARWTWSAPPEVADFALSVSPQELQLKPGKTARATISIQRLGGYPIPVKLSPEDIPYGVQAEITPSVTASPTSSLELHIAPEAAIGTHRISIVGETLEYGFRRTAHLTLVVLQPTFTMKVSPLEIYLISGERATINITFDREIGLSEPISLKIENVPEDVVALLDPPTWVTGDKATLTIITTPTTSFGIHTISIVAATDKVQRVATVEVTIIPQELVRTISMLIIIVGISLLAILGLSLVIPLIR